MPYCRGCGLPFDWGYCDGRWVPLEPIATHDDLDRTYLDENNVLRADHRDRHPGGETVNVIRLDKKVKADEVEPLPLLEEDMVFVHETGEER